MALNLIFYGTLPDDHTGDKNRSCWIKADGMFVELYGLIGSASPVAGNKYGAFRNAVKHFMISEQNLNDLFYISRIVCGTSAGSGIYNYQVDVKLVHNLTNAGDLVIKYEQILNHIVTDPMVIYLALVSPSVLHGFMVIDFSKLTTGQEYTCANWIEGGLMNPAMAKAQTGGGIDPGGGNADLPEFTESFEADGSLPIYIGNSPDPITSTLSAMANIKGDIKFKNIGAGVMTIESPDDKTIDGVGAIYLSQGQWATLFANNTKFEAIGNYSLSPP